MDNLIKQIGIGAIGVTAYLFGDINGLFLALLICMILDFITGIIVAVIEKTVSSHICAKGIAKKVLMLFIVVLGHLVDFAVIGDGETVRNIVICFYLANECISILENSGRLGVPYPKKLKDILAQLKDKSDKDDK